MDELYIESFSKKQSAIIAETDNRPMIDENLVAEVYEFNNQMHYYLDQLEKIITDEFGDFTDFRFVFDRIKKNLKENKTKVILATLHELEELVDLGLPFLALKT